MTRVAVIGGGMAGLTAARRLALDGAEVVLFEGSSRLGGLLERGMLGGGMRVGVTSADGSRKHGDDSEEGGSWQADPLARFTGEANTDDARVQGDAATPLEAVRDPLAIDIGAEAFAVRGGAVESLIRALGLENELVEPRALGSWGLGAAGAYPLPKGGLLGIPAGPDAPGLLEAVGPEGVEAVRAEASLDPAVGADAENLAELVRARFGPLVLDRLVAPVTRGVYSLDPSLVDHRVLAPGLIDRLAEHGSLSLAIASQRRAASPGALVRGIRGGMQRLVDALAADCVRLGVDIRLDAPAAIRDGSAVRPRPAAGPVVRPCPTASGPVIRFLPAATDLDAGPGSDPGSGSVPGLGRGWLAERPSGSAHGRAGGEHFDRVLVTTASAIGDAADPVPSEVVALLVEAPELDGAPRGTGVLVADAPGVAAKALTHVTAKWPWLDERTPAGAHVLRLSYGPRPARSDEQGAAAPVTTEPRPPAEEHDGGFAPPPRALTAGLPDAEVAALALADASRILDVPLDASRLRGLARREWRMPAPAARVGRAAQLERIRAELDALPGLDACGTWIDGTGLASVIPGAERAAERILR
ncbi:NAD(P)/FAD-dependent oxidoreductase [Gulosibacter sp. 10]|uniref:protoporphyrinogen/coproporphyrinogen oxidase n=1 Tax=Gulosibacter sp. 10 TaxID=1255570 RepID=UPI00097ED232|nr:FAD-dependent oxidoreductase [Gulosibacter sp. 10]SJM60473.1 Protoporphyrinogen IX oxidase, aerobic, HemY [Gulosibacter sp. 10]